MDFTQMFPIYPNVFFSSKLEWSFSHLSRFNWSCWTIPKYS